MRGDRRGSAASRGYDARWRRYRMMFLRENPLCVLCRPLGRIRAATVVDHIEPHRGDYKTFWDPANHQSLCASCHSGPKQSLERTGRLRGCDEEGNPIDPGHHWRRGDGAPAD
jgi:5-methylcytosine-specific restriction endonuclease McrA